MCQHRNRIAGKLFLMDYQIVIEYQIFRILAKHFGFQVPGLQN
jgi:hypothetical protein